MLTMTEHWFPSWDGLSIFYRAWRPVVRAQRAVVVFHRGHEHSGRWAHLVESLAPSDCAVFIWDARGNGRTAGPRDDAASFSCYTKDADAFVRHVSAEEGILVENMAVVGHSVGGAVAAAWVHDFAPRIRALVLGTPAFRIRLYVPFAVQLLRLAQKIGVMKTVPSYVKARVLTHDTEEIRRYNADPLITHAISSRILIDLFDTSRRVMKDAGAIRTPTLLLVGEKDWVVDIGAERRFFNRLGSTVKRFDMLSGFYHDIFHEKGKATVLATARAFMEECFNRDLPPPLLTADREGPSRVEYDLLLRPLPLLSPRRWAYALVKTALATIGRLSQGIRLGWESGFNSGRTLEYVYRNQSQGWTPLGRFLDRVYLGGAGWRGIRVRGDQIRAFILRAIQQAAKAGAPVHVADIAAGGGRYVLGAVKASGVAATILLRDREPKNLAEAAALASAEGVLGVQTQVGDAFDGRDLAALSPRPSVAVVSGLYELFPDNGRVLESLRGLAAAVPSGGFLVYTNQPWHPQLELIARTLVDWDGKPWVMRRRSQAEMDDLVHAAGFVKVAMDIDPWGIFTVSLAVRRAEGE